MFINLFEKYKKHLKYLETLIFAVKKITFNSLRVKMIEFKSGFD